MLLFPPFKKQNHSPEVDKEMAMQDTTLTQDLLPAKKLTFVDATHELTQSVTEYERYFFPGTNNDNNKEKEEDVTLIKKAKKDPNAHSLRRYI
jgi:hypothetical protein|tara:strand:- start:4070 stop:4348 length:279 start_codon:yes stop_codon:yes gene_type:complete